MLFASIEIRLSLAVFLLAVLSVFAKSGRGLGRMGGVLRGVLAIFYSMLVVAGVAGLILSGWLLFVARGAALLLLVPIVPLSLFLISTGSALFQFVLSGPAKKQAPLVNSSGWSELSEAAERARNARVAPHLRPEALAKFGRDNEEAP